MKNKKIKKLVGIIILLTTILVSCKTNAAIYRNGYGDGKYRWYYTYEDLQFYDYQIHIYDDVYKDYNGDYYCTNHLRTLRGRDGRRQFDGKFRVFKRGRDCLN